MSLKTTIRRYLPPTERNFEDKIKHLEHQINDILSECRELHIANENLYNQLEATKRYMQLRQATSYYESAVCRASSNISDNRILLAGWYGERNFGDELMLRTVLSHIPEESIRNVTIMLWPDLNYPRFCLDHRINIVHWPNTLWELDAIANSFDALVWGGGAIIDDKQFSDDYFNINVGNIYI